MNSCQVSENDHSCGETEITDDHLRLNINSNPGDSINEKPPRKVLDEMTETLSELFCIRHYPFAVFLSVLMFLSSIADQDIIDTIVLYVEFQYQWSLFQVGAMMAWAGVWIAIFQALVLKFLLTKMNERSILLLGLIFYVFGHMLIAFAFEGWMLYFILLLPCAGSIGTPTLQSLLLSAVPVERHGTVLGFLTSVTTVARMIGALIATNVFAYFTLIFPGAPYIVGSWIYFLTTVLAFFIFKRYPISSQPSVVQQESNNEKENKPKSQNFDEEENSLI